MWSRSFGHPVRPRQRSSPDGSSHALGEEHEAVADFGHRRGDVALSETAARGCHRRPGPEREGRVQGSPGQHSAAPADLSARTAGAGQVPGRVHAGSRGLPRCQSGRRQYIRRTLWPFRMDAGYGCRRPEQPATAVLPGGTRWLVAMAGEVPDVFAGLTHSQICAHGPFKPVEMNRGDTSCGHLVKEALIF